MAKKYDLKTIKEKLLVINPNIEILSTKYINCETKLKLKCKIDNNIWYATWANLSQKNRCPICAKESMKNKMKLSLEEAKQEFIKRAYIPLFDDYHKNNEKLLCKTKEGYLIETTVNNLKSGSKPKIFHKKNPYTINNIKIWLKLNNKPYELLSNKYTDSHVKLKWSCSKHGVFFSSWNNILTGYHCAKCGYENTKNKRTLSFEQLKNIVKSKNPNIDILSEKYKNSNSKVKCKCSIDGYIWYTTGKSLLSGRGCKMCRDRNRKGEGHHNWKGGITSLNNYLRENSFKNWKKDSMKACDYK
ncbi:TPA: hypothetical protein ACXDAZ_002547 [Clostridium botulinum]